MKPTAAISALMVSFAGLATGMAPAVAAPAPIAEAACVTPNEAGRGQVKRAPDTRPVTNSDLTRAKRVDRLHDRRAQRVAGPIVVKVHVHVIKGRHASDRYATTWRVNKTLEVLNDAYAAGQSANNTDTGFTFKVVSKEVLKRDRWYHARPGGYYDRKMRRTLHKGGRDALNIYFVRPRATAEGAVLGWATFPSDYAYYPRQDGLSLNIRAIPRGAFRGYNLGDTAVHEVGHWLGLAHTFEGGPCDPVNDGISDTPAQYEATYGCPEGADTCADDPGLDPIHNFMDYGTDPCMWEFTPEQVARMQAQWLEYRQRTA